MIRTMGLFLLLLLKILGWVLLILLLLLIAVVLLVLFVPVRYDIRMQNKRSTEPGQKNPIAELQLQLKVNWLLHLLHVTVSYGPEGLQNKIRVAGIDIPKLLAQLPKRREARHKRREEKKRRRTVQESQNSLQTKNSAAEADKTESENSEIFSQAEDETGEDRQVSEESIGKTEKEPSAEAGSVITAKEQGQPLKKKSDSDIKEQTQVFKDSSETGIDTEEQSEKPEAASRSQKHRERLRKKNRKKAVKTEKQKKLPKKASKPQKESVSSEPGMITKIRTQLGRLHKEYVDETNRHAVSHLWKELRKLLRSYKPRKLKADVTFSLANPALTGGAVGAISLLPWIYRYPCSIVPDFTSEKLYIEGEVLVRGKVTVSVFVFSLLRLLCDKEFKQVVRRVIKRDGPQL